MANTLRYDAVRARELPTALVERWRALLPSDGDLASPFFHPGYALAAAEVLEGVEVCVVTSRGHAVGFYPFERTEAHTGRPVGGAMSNFQGMLAAADVAWSATQLVRGAGLHALGFHHQVQGQPAFDPYVQRTVASPLIDLTGGWDAYLDARRAAGVSSFNALPRKMRKIERELGPLRFEAHSDDARALASLVAWKRAQYERGSLHRDWAVHVLQRLFARQSPDFAGMLSTLWAGDRLIAVHAGIRTARCWHYWFPAYDPAVGALSPGLVLIHEMCRWAASVGITRIDLGPGEGAHKTLFQSGATTVGVGTVNVPRGAPLITRLLGGLRRRRMPRS